MTGVQSVISLKDQSGGVSVVFDDVNPTEFTTEAMDIPSIRDFEDKSDGVVSYLKRAININSYTWSSATSGQFLVVDPWSYLATNVPVKDKVKYFSTLKGKLHVRIVTNGTPFHYGRIVVSYVPLYSVQTADYRAKYLQVPLIFQVQNCEINPTTSLPVEMQLEMFTDQDFLPLQGQNATSLTDMGRLLFTVLAPLGSANAASPDPITIQIYAWWDDVALGVPTPYADVLQAGDEMTSRGPISKIATTVASTASFFKNIPIIGRFATATEIGAKAVGSIAGLFGYSNPPLANRGEFVKKTTAVNFCQVSGRDSSKLMSMDPLRQLSIDPKSVGFPARDEMSFAFLYKIPCYLRTITWTTAQTPGTLLALIGVSPCSTWQVVPAAGEVDHYQGPIQMMSHLCENWTGSLKFRFKVVCSTYHKGRLVFRYHPYRTTQAISGYGEVTSQAVVFDIGLDSEKELIVDWSRPQLWLTTRNDVAPKDSTLDSNTNAGGTQNNCPVNCNGEISVEVLTELTAPVSTASITIHVFMEGTDSLRYSDWNSAISAAPGMAQFQAGENTELEYGEVKSSRLGLLKDTPTSLLKVTVGEEIASVRALLRRPSLMGYNYKDTTGPIGDGKTANFGFYYPAAIDDFGTGSTNFIKLPIQSNMQVWKNCYVGYKGSIRYKIMRINAAPTRISIANTQLIKTSKMTNAPIVDDLGAVIGLTTTTTNYLMLKNQGWAVLDPSDPVIEFEVPDLATKKFRLSTGDGPSVYDSVLLVDTVNGWSDSTTTLVSDLMYEVMISAGEDFSLFYFTGCPMMHTQPTGWAGNNNFPNRNT